MSAILEADKFIQLIIQNSIPIIDVRSQAEFLHAHFPGAQNMPLLNNEERVIIGTTYKKKGREEAVHKGFELVGPRFHEFIEQAKSISPNKKIAIYCWRGGMRSGIVSWVLSMAGFQTTLLKGGYKSFRKWTLEKFDTKKNCIVLGGKTGSGKTEILQHLKQKGQQVIDLEKLAHHKGSAFGSLGMPSQPTVEHFENMLALEWDKIKPDTTVWLENESRSIGKVIIPGAVFEQIRNAVVVEINLDYDVRKKRILAEYGIFDKASLAEKTKLITKRLGFDIAKQSLQYLEENNLNAWCDNMMRYYDKTYSHGLSIRKNKIIAVDLKDDAFLNHIDEIILKSKQLMQ